MLADVTLVLRRGQERQHVGGRRQLHDLVRACGRVLDPGLDDLLANAPRTDWCVGGCVGVWVWVCVCVRVSVGGVKIVHVYVQMYCVLHAISMLILRGNVDSTQEERARVCVCMCACLC